MAPPHEELPTVRLENKWSATALRHPSLRLLGCVAHTVVTFFLCSSSPLNASVQAPAHFPVLSHWIAVTLSRVTWEKVVFHVLLNAVLVLLLRLVVYRKLVQRSWNWRRQYFHAQRAFSRLSSSGRMEGSTLQESDEHDADALAEPHVMMDLHTRVSTITTGLSSSPYNPATRVKILANATSQGSWTFVACCYPFFWSATVWFLETTMKDMSLEDSLFSTSDDTLSHGMAQMRAQGVLYQTLMTLSLLKLLLTLDQLLQDVHYSRFMYDNWLVNVRKIYTKYTLLRLLSCWLTVAALLVGGLYFQALSALQNVWMAFNLDSKYANYTQLWFSNEPWIALLGGCVVALDILWLVQDFGFPGFPTPVGFKLFGCTTDALRIFKTPTTLFTSKWASCFVVLGLLLPLEMCHFIQIFTYAPKKYGQYADDATQRVFPLIESLSRSDLPSDLSDVELKLLQQGSISRYFEWSAWERAPALGLILLTLGLGAWLWREERFKVRFSVFLGASGHTQQAQQEDGQVIHDINAKLSTATKSTIAKQRRIRELYALRSRIDNFCITLAALSVVAVVLQFRSIWRSQKLSPDPMDDAAATNYQALWFPGEAYGMLLLLLTLCLMHQLYQRYVVKMQLLVLRNELPRASDKRLRDSPRQLLLPFVIELVLCGACLPPFVHSGVVMQETRYSLVKSSAFNGQLLSCPSRLTPANNVTGAGHSQDCDLNYAYPLEIVNMIVLVRLYWFVRVIRNRLLGKVVTAEHLLVVSGVLQQVPIDSLHWSFKVAFKLAPGKLLLSLFVFFWAGTAAAVSIFERPFPSLLDNEEHSLWMTIVTMSGVGYGDAYPMTAYGRVSTFLGAVVGGAILVSLMTSVFLEAVKGSKEEHTVLGAMERAQWQKRMWHASAVLIASSWRRYKLRAANSSGKDASSKTMSKVDRQLFGVAHQFKLLRKQKPKETYDSIEALKMAAIAHWRANELTKWMVEIHEETHSGLDVLENQLDAIERSLHKVLA